MFPPQLYMSVQNKITPAWYTEQNFKFANSEKAKNFQGCTISLSFLFGDFVIHIMVSFEIESVLNKNAN